MQRKSGEGREKEKNANEEKRRVREGMEKKERMVRKKVKK